MKNPSWAKVFAFFGFAIMGLALALYSTAVATAGVTAGIIGRDRGGEVLTNGSALLLAGIAVAAACGFVALTQTLKLVRRA